MSRRWPMRSALLAIIAAVMVVSCESATAPEPVAPESSSDLLDLGKLLKKILPPPPEDGGDEDGGDEEDGRDGEDSRDDEDEDGTSSSELTFVVESAPGPAKLVSGVFSVLGGVLSVDEHGIAVPRGALVRPTLFTMQTVAGPVIDVDLNAFESGPAEPDAIAGGALQQGGDAGAVVRECDERGGSVAAGDRAVARG